MLSYLGLCVLARLILLVLGIWIILLNDLHLAGRGYSVFCVVSSEWGSKFPTMIMSLVLVGSALEAAPTIIFAVTISGHWGVM